MECNRHPGMAARTNSTAGVSLRIDGAPPDSCWWCAIEGLFRMRAVPLETRRLFCVVEGCGSQQSDGELCRRHYNDSLREARQEAWGLGIPLVSLFGLSLSQVRARVEASR